MTEEEKPNASIAPKQTGPHFIPKLRGKKSIIRLISDTLIWLAKAKIGIKNFGAKKNRS